MILTESQYNSIYQMATQLIRFDKQKGVEIGYDNIATYIQRALDFARTQCDDDDFGHLFTDIEYEFAIVHTMGECIFNEYDIKDWYSNDSIKDNFFWSRYKRYLIENTTIDSKSISLLEEKTLPEIMNCLGNPNDELTSKRLRRGLIIGDVQSGKTATYSGLICKAADAGYKVVILLAGITESLRQQTQERIDEGIVGYSIRLVEKLEKRGVVGVGIDNKARRATSFTSCIKDFVGDCDKISTTLSEHKSLVLFVVKKNVSVLNKLYKWLEENNIDVIKGCVDHPMLLIDDEADNASVNTKKDETDPTKTNKIIRQICNLFMNATYVGFTATPFANVFIDPDSVDAMKHADLFPEHFIYTLPTPSTYIGAEKIFYNDGERHGNLRYIVDIEEPDYESEEYKQAVKSNSEELNSRPFYSRHKKEWDGILPKSLREAVLCFYLANVVRDLRGQKSKPRSMLVNMSRFIRVQNLIKEHIEQIHNDFLNVVRYDFSDDTKLNKKLPLFIELELIWKKHFSNIMDVSFDRVVSKDALYNAVCNIQIVVVNGGKSSGKLDYKTNSRLRVIAVGGLALSRGLTLEGLLVSYFYRNTATFDVLMQMGRWFGYRTGYEDLFQIWTSKISADWYQEIAIASNELKHDIKKMYDQHLTPKDFGIRVRDYCDELQITAANKMRTTYDLLMLESYYGTIYGTSYLSRNVDNNLHNWNQVKNLCEVLFDQGYKLQYADIDKHKGQDIDANIGASRFFADVPKSVVSGFLSKIKCSLVNLRFNVENILDFINDQETIGLDNWDIVFEGGDGETYYNIPGLERIRCMERAVYSHDNVIQVTSRRTVLGLREGKFALKSEEIALAEARCRSAWQNEGSDNPDRTIPLKAYFQYLPQRNPLLIIMLLEPKIPKDCPDDKKVNKFVEELSGNKIVAFAVGFPGVEETPRMKKYKVNKIYYELNLQDEPDEIEEDNEN